ncbi:site-2 protease family protein [Candidatus Poribacteria bacterium]|nr:site-2 protease family protein [Candidatus Poribacteria bacterium]
MNWAFKIGSIFGIPVRIHVIFLLLFLLFLLPYMVEGRIGEGISLTLIMFILFGCVVLHELGHSLMARRYRIKVHDIILLPIGGVARMQIPEDPSIEIRLALVGPAVNFSIALLSALVLLLTRRPLDLSLSISPYNVIGLIFKVNLWMGLFNLIPAFPMDGGRVFRGVLAMRYDYLQATHIASQVGRGIAVILALFGIYKDVLLIFIGLFVFIAAGGEERAVQMRRTLREIPVGEVMSRNVFALAPDQPIRDALEHIYRGLQDEFPVVREGGELVGMLTKPTLMSLIKRDELDRWAGEVMESEFPFVTIEDTLADVYRKMADSSKSAMPVVENGVLRGMISLENIGRYFMVRSIGDRKEEEGDGV